jgi:carbamoyl-phosphate synthase large subunit
MKMILNFTKMHGCGNDYVYFDCFGRDIPQPERLAVFLSDRHFGVGGDGIVLIRPSNVADAQMRMYNADGSEGKMCGNAIRCVAKYLYDNGIAAKNRVTIDTLSGVKTLELNIDGGKAASASVDMGAAELDPAKIPVALDLDRVIGHEITVGGDKVSVTCVSMGNPHCVVFTTGADGLDLEKIGPRFENNPIFPERTNTEFVEVLDRQTLKMRVWERGSGETLACGTGACAAVVAAALNGYCEKGRDIRVLLAGGELRVNYSDERVIMTGPAVKVFDGTIDVREDLIQ